MSLFTFKFFYTFSCLFLIIINVCILFSQALNPVFILIFIPLFEGAIYPLLDKCGVPKRPLQRMAGGMVLAALAFVCAGLLQIKIEVSEVIFLIAQ